MKNLLTTKALHRELIIMVEHETELTRELKKNGASVYYYGDIGFVPMSRFTIVDFERLDARVTIGVRNDGLHSIKEHDAASSVEYYLANDLVRMIIERNAKNVSINTAAKSI